MFLDATHKLFRLLSTKYAQIAAGVALRVVCDSLRVYARVCVLLRLILCTLFHSQLLFHSQVGDGLFPDAQHGKHTTSGLVVRPNGRWGNPACCVRLSACVCVCVCVCVLPRGVLHTSCFIHSLCFIHRWEVVRTVAAPHSIVVK